MDEKITVNLGVFLLPLLAFTIPSPARTIPSPALIIPFHLLINYLINWVIFNRFGYAF